jgi:hypothetical protein
MSLIRSNISPAVAGGDGDGSDLVFSPRVSLKCHALPPARGVRTFSGEIAEFIGKLREEHSAGSMVVLKGGNPWS